MSIIILLVAWGAYIFELPSIVVIVLLVIGIYQLARDIGDRKEENN